MSNQSIQNLATIMIGFEELENRKSEHLPFMCKEAIAVITELGLCNTAIKIVKCMDSTDTILSHLYNHRKQLLSKSEMVKSYLEQDLTIPNDRL